MISTVYFSHGLESGPWGTKIKRLGATAERHGLSVRSIDYRGIRLPAARVEKLVSQVSQEPPDSYILVGSSMGGYVSFAATDRLRPAGLFLLAPAVMMPNYPPSDFLPQCAQIEVVHAWDDEVIPVENVLSFARRLNCTCHLVAGEHRLLGEALELTDALFQSFLLRLNISPPKT